MAHRSWCSEAGGVPSNERLEFLGDAVLGLVVADLAFGRHLDLPEGKLTDLRKSVVSAVALADVARELGLGEHVRLGRGEDAAGGRDKPSILSDALEAVFGAVYVDGGHDEAFRVIEGLVGQRMSRAAQQLDRFDHKSALQETVVRLFDLAPVYVVSETGPAHDKRFTATVLVRGEALGRGEGTSKKFAEQAAASEALHALRSSPGDEG
jgi:ribonuclease-3